jgi:hypothetical protein
MRFKIWVAAVAVVAMAAATLTARQLKTPADWKVRLDGPGSVTATDPAGNEMMFVAMPPGWHITTGPGALLYHPEYAGRGNFSVEAEIFLFPGDSTDEYGVFLGGRDLDSATSHGYVAFVARRDGKGAVIRKGGTSPIVDWRTNTGILPHPGKDTVKNVLRVDVGTTDVVFSANGTEVIKLPRTGLNLEGRFGFRVGKGINVHASRLDVTYRLAPIPIK